MDVAPYTTSSEITMHNCPSCNRLILEETKECPFCGVNHRKKKGIPRSVTLLGASATMFVMAACYGSGPLAYQDMDRDGHTYPTDCDDDNPLIYPKAREVCTDSIDNDCDGLIDKADPDCPKEEKKKDEKKEKQ